ncbi:hypothetical protein S83_061693, partial [Arachis hypogaea]
ILKMDFIFLKFFPTAEETCSAQSDCKRYVKYYIWRDQIQFQVHKEARQKIQVCSYLQLLAQFIRHGLPVLNKEGNLASLDTDEGGWVFDSSSSEVQYPGVQHIIMIDIHNLQAFALYMQKADIKFDLCSITTEMET